MRKNFKLLLVSSILLGGLVAVNNKNKDLENLNLVEEKVTNVKKAKVTSATNVEEETASLSIRTGENAGLRFKYHLSSEELFASFGSERALTDYTYGILVAKTVGTGSIKTLITDQTLNEGVNTISDINVYNCVASNVNYDDGATFAGVLVGFNSEALYNTYFSTIGYVTDGEKTYYTEQYYASYSYAVEQYLDENNDFDLTSDQKNELEAINSTYSISSKIDVREKIEKGYNVDITKETDYSLLAGRLNSDTTKASYSAIKLNLSSFNNGNYAGNTLSLKVKGENIKDNKVYVYAIKNDGSSDVVVGSSTSAILSEDVQNPGISVSSYDEDKYLINLDISNALYGALDDDGNLICDYLRIQFANATTTEKAYLKIEEASVSKTSIQGLKLDEEINDLSNTLAAHGSTITKDGTNKYSGSYSIFVEETAASQSLTLPITYANLADKKLIFYVKAGSGYASGYTKLSFALANGTTRLATAQALYIPFTSSHSVTAGTSCVQVENSDWWKCEFDMNTFIANSGTFTESEVTDIRIQFQDSNAISIYIDNMYLE